MPSFSVFKGRENGEIHQTETTKPALTRDQVALKVTASGLCGTDLHYKTAGIGLGHEGIGVVQALGPDCRFLREGDRVGWGYEHDACGHCSQCLMGNETFCPQRAMYGDADCDQGSFASNAVWREAFLFRIPDEIPDEYAAPLQCAGATIWNALNGYNVTPNETVAVVGLGGLGHLAIQFAAKMGCRVVAISGSETKKEEAFQLGAHEFVATKDNRKLNVSRPIDRLLVTTSAQPDWNLLLPILAPGAKIFPLSVSEGDFQIPYMQLLILGITVQGSIIAPRYLHKQMLEFAALHSIRPVIEKFPMTEKGITQAMEKLDKGQMRYRAVLVQP